MTYNSNKTGNVRTTQHCGAFVQLLLQWKSYVTYSERLFVILGIQHAMRMRRIILSSVACPAVLYISTYLINGTI